MIKSITVTNYLGDSIKMELARPEESGFVIRSIKGLGPGKATINTSEVSTNDGSLYNSARLPSRNIILSLGFLWLGSIEEMRQKSYKYFPIKQKVKLLIETDNRNAEIEGYVESNEPDIFTKESGTEISLICPNPFFYSAGQNGINTTVFHGIDPVFEFPFSNDSLTDPLLIVGDIENKTEKLIIYNGDAEIGINIYMHALGPASNVRIYNTGTREIMFLDTAKLTALTGSGIVQGDEIAICTVKGNKTVTLLRGGVRTNILNCLARSSDWFQLSKGDNIFTYTAEAGGSNLQFKIENRIIYEGV